NLANASKSTDKAVIGGAYKDYLKQIQSQLGLTNKELIVYIKNARSAAQEAIFSAGTQEEADSLTMSIEVMNEQLKQLGAWEEDTANKTQSLRTRIKEAKEELVAMAEAGLQGTPAFRALQEKAGEMDDQMRDLNATVKGLGSDTKRIDGLISLAGGVAGGFAVAQGAAALFGNENEEVQKALLKVNAAMSILQGLQAVQNVLQKESAASLLFNTGARKANTVATEAANVSTAKLNATMALNPVMAIVVGVIALTTALIAFSENSKEAAETQSKLNEALAEGSEFLDAELRGLEAYSEKTKALAKEQGASSLEMAKIDERVGNQKLKSIHKSITAITKLLENEKVVNKLSEEDYKKLVDKKTELEIKLNETRNALEVKGADTRKMVRDQEVASYIAMQDAKVLATRAGSLAEMKAQIDAIKVTRAVKDSLNPDLTPGEKAKNAAEDARAIAGLELQIYTSYLKSITNATEAELIERKRLLLKNKIDTLKDIQDIAEAEIAVIKKRRDEQLKSNPNLSKGEREKIEAEAAMDIEQIEVGLSKKVLEIRRSGINAQVLLAKKGSQEELMYKIQALQVSQELELQTEELTQEKIDEINAKYDEQRRELNKNFLIAQKQDEISYINASIERVGIADAVKLSLTLSRLSKQREVEILQADGNAAKIAEINAKYEQQTLDTKKDFIKKEYDEKLRALELYSFRAMQENRRILESEFGSDEDKIAAIKSIEDNEKKKRDIKIESLQRQFRSMAISQKEFDDAMKEIDNERIESEQSTQKKISDIYKKQIDTRIALYRQGFEIMQKGITAVFGDGSFSNITSGLQNIAATAMQSFSNLKNILDDSSLSLEEKSKAKIEAYKAVAVAVIQSTQQVVNQLFAESAAARQQALEESLSKLEEQKSKELAAENLSAQQKADIEERYKQKERQEKVKAFNADKNAKKTQAIINGLLAVTNTLATAPWPINLIMAAIVATTTAIQVAKISATPVPKFKHGKKKGQYEGFGIVDDGGKVEPILRSDGTIEMASTAKERLTYLKKDDIVFPSMEAMKNHFTYPSTPSEMRVDVGKSSPINYDRLAEAVASKMAGIIPAPAQIHNTIDGDSIRTFLIKGNLKNERKNKYFSMT
ncbi:MAG: hypothetical protein LC096_09500, partial [Bacteroidia bacterium]|nr:hypothetical protein [Bacteroidia bacterium]